MGLMPGGWTRGCRLGDGAMGRGDSNAPLKRFYIRAFDRPYVLPCFYRAGLARRYSSQPARWLLTVTIVINDDNYYKEVNFPIMGVITSLWALLQPSLSRIIGRSDFSYSRVFSGL